MGSQYIFVKSTQSCLATCAGPVGEAVPSSIIGESHPPQRLVGRPTSQRVVNNLCSHALCRAWPKQKLALVGMRSAGVPLHICQADQPYRGAGWGRPLGPA